MSVYALYRLPVELTLKTPLLSRSSDAVPINVDTAMQIRDGYPVLGGSLIRGNIRHCWQEFVSLMAEGGPVTAEEINDWLGSPSDGDDQMAPARGLLRFDSWWCCETKKPASPATQTRISINAETGTVEQGSLQVMETLFAPGKELTFEGSIWLTLPEDCPQTRTRIEGALARALNWIPALGSNKGVGYGELVSASLGDWERQQAESAPLMAGTTARRWRLKVKPLEPFCIANPQSREPNRFEAREWIGGNVLKGCIAAMVKDPAVLQAAGFDQWQLRHALPLSPENEGDVSRPLPLPLSLARLGDAESAPWYDLIGQPAGLVDGKLPVFMPDWKEKDREVYAQWLPERTFGCSLQVHTALNERFKATPDSDGGALKAKTSQLFSMELVEPTLDCWFSELDLTGLDNEAFENARQLLNSVLGVELPVLGKTAARMTLALEEADAVADVKPAGEYRVQLVTEARLLPCDLDELPNATGLLALNKAYQRYFHQASEGSLVLKTQFSRQHRYGGRYYQRRFRNKDATYRPEWLTQPGAVFLLEPVAGQEEKAQEILQQWLARGLPVAEDRASDNWASDPYRPEHGYGEIVINRDDIPVYNQQSQV